MENIEKGQVLYIKTSHTPDNINKRVTVIGFANNKNFSTESFCSPKFERYLKEGVFIRPLDPIWVSEKNDSTKSRLISNRECHFNSVLLVMLPEQLSEVPVQ